MPRTLFISDLHLGPELPRTAAGLFRFLAEEAAGADALYVLGDLFEAWVGDDNHNEFNDAVVAAFRRLSASGTRLYFQNGNRDFVLGQAFATACGGQMLGESEVIDIYGQPLLIMHGDQLCTLDAKYMAFRAQCRDPVWQGEMLAKPLDQRLMMATLWRAQSKAMNANKPENIMDVTPDEVVRVLDAAGASTLLHGHTHRPAEHTVSLAHGQGRRLVLGDWREDSGEAVIAVADSTGVRLQEWHY
jgi:UDP-2,3-diacylglucosamine hydrolase